MGTLTNLTAAQIAALSASRIWALTASDIAGMTADQLGGLTATQLMFFNATQLAAFSRGQMASLSLPALKGFSPTQIAMLKPDQVSGFTPAQISSFNPGQVTGLSAADIAALSPAQIASLTAADIPVLGTAQIKALTAAQVAALTPAELKAFSPSQIANLTSSAQGGLTNAQRAVLTSAQLAKLTPVVPAPAAPNPPPVAPPVTPAVTPQVTPQVAPSVTPSVTPAPAPLATPAAKPVAAPVAAPVATPPDPFTPALLAAMTPAQIAALTASQINSFSATQLGSLNITYSSMLAILQADATGGINATEFSALQALVSKFNVPGGIKVSDYLQQMADNVVLGNSANAFWTGGAATPTALGNMTAASSQTQASELIGKWFLGTDHPDSQVNVNGGPALTVAHVAVAKPLFAAAGPTIDDVNQGQIGDCFMLAPLAAMAAQDPAAIRAMITDNGNNTYAVRFFVDGKAQYVTVDNTLANGGGIFTGGADDWAGLIEKAYTQLQAGGNTTGANISFGNNYSSIANGGSPATALAEFTGADTITQFAASGSSWSSMVFDGKSLTTPNNHNIATVLSSDKNLATSAVQATMIADLAAGDEVILSSYTNDVDATGKTTLVANHAMTVYGFDTTTGMFEIYNPWGARSSGQTWDTRFEASLGSLLADGDVISIAGKPAQPLMAATPTTLMPGTTQAFGGSSLGLAAALG